MEEFPDFDSFDFGTFNPNGNFGSAIAGVPSLGGISGPNDFADWFRVTLVEGRQYDIQLRGAPTGDGTLADPYFYGIYDLGGNFIEGTSNDDGGTGLNSRVQFTAPYSGTYYFSVTDAENLFDSSGLVTGGTYTLEFNDLSAPEVINEGDNITLSIQTEIPSQIPFPGSGTLNDFVVSQQISVIVTSAEAVRDEDFTVSYSFGAPQTLNFAALRDDLVEDDEEVSVRIVGTVEWSNATFGGTIETQIDVTRNFIINSAPFGVPDPILDYTFTESEVIGNVLTNFADGSEELFTVIPFAFESPTATGELLENGDILINSATGRSGDSLVIRFTAVDSRGAQTASEQIIEFGALDDYLPGEDALVLGSIDVGTPELGSIEQLGDRDRFVVTLEAGQLYSIGLVSASDGIRTLADPEIFGVFNSLNVALPNSGDDNSGTGLNALAGPLSVPTTGQYEIEVGSHTPFGLGGYELSVTSLGAADDYLPGAFADVFGTAEVDSPAFGSIEQLGDRDRFEVTLQAGVEYDISLTAIAASGGSSVITPEIVGVFGPGGAFVPLSSANQDGANVSAVLSDLTVPNDGVYQIEVGDALDTSTGDYELRVDFSGFVDDFLPGIAGGVGAVAVGGRSTGEIETIGDIDAFRVTLQANTTYQIGILGQESNNGTLLDPELLGLYTTSDLSGTPIRSVQTLDPQLIEDDSISYFTPQTAGDYFIAVQDGFGGLGTYTVAVTDLGFRDDFSADIDTTGSITPGSTANGRIDFAQDNDWFEVNLSAGRLYQINLVSLEGADTLADPFFNGVYDGAGNLIENTANDDGGTGTSSSLQFVADESGTYYLSAAGFGNATGQYRIELNDLGPLDDGRFDITIAFASDDVPNSYRSAFEDAVERWEDIITGDLPYAFVDGYGYVDDILIEVAVDDIELSFEGVSQNILAISSVLDQRDGLSGADALPTYSRIVINSEEVGTLLNLDEFVANTIGRALGFGALWEEFGLVRLIDGVPTYTGPNGLRELAELNDDLNGVNALEDGELGGLAAEYWSEAIFDEELMTSRVETRRPEAGPGSPGIPDNPISALTVAAMQDLGYTVDYDEADFFRLDPGALSRHVTTGQDTTPEVATVAQSVAQHRLLSDLADTDGIPAGAAYIYTRPNALSETPASFALNDVNTELVFASGTNAVFIEAVTGDSLNIELTGTFSKNDPVELSQLSGTVTSMEVRSLVGQLLFSVDYTQEPTTVADIAAQWPNYAMDGENIIIIDTLPGTVARVNPNGGGAADNRIFTGASDDFVRGGDLAELIHGEADNDSLQGRGGNDSLIGGSGDDTLEGGTGDDLVNGESGIDMAVFSGAQSAYSLTLGNGSTIIEDRRGDGNGRDTLIGIEMLDFDTDFFEGTPFNLQQFGGTTGLSATDFENFIELYIAYFNRAPDAVGLNFWGTAFANGVSLAESARLFVGQDETVAAYPSDLSNSDLVTTIYQNVLGRIPDQAGFDFWVNSLDSGGIGRDIAILGILEGAKADPFDGAPQDFIDQQLADRAFLANKTDIGAYFAVHKGMSDVDNASEVMALFNGSAESITAAVARADAFHTAALNPNSGEFLMTVIGVLDDPFSGS